MSDRSSVLLALAAAAGAWAAAPVPPALALAIAVAGLARRRPVVLMVGVALAASCLSHRAWAGLQPPVEGPWRGVVTLVGDPADVAGAVRVEVRLGGRRVEAWARGRAAGRLADRLSGERVALAGQVRPLPPQVRARLASRHVAARMTVDEVGHWGWGNGPTRLANRLRRTLASGAESLPPGRRALFAGFVLGDDRGQPPEVTADFRAAGLTHLLAVSGQNVAFLLLLLRPVLGRLSLGGRLAAGATAISFFGLLTRWEPSVLRAVAMAGLALLASTLGRPVSSARLLSLAATGLLLVDPLLIRSVGFLLSVGACSGIALLARPVAQRLPGPRALSASVGVTLAAQAGVAPVLVPVFGGLPVASLPANLLALPVAGPLMMWGLAAGLVAGVAGGRTAEVLHLPTSAALWWVEGVARWSAQAPLGRLQAGHVAMVVAAAGLALVATHRGRARPYAVALAALLGAAALLLPAAAAVRPGPLDGRPLGRGVEVWRRDGATVLVVRGAPGSSSAVLSALRSSAVRRIDVMVVTGAGPTAAEVASAVLRRYRPRLLLAPAGQRLPGASPPVPGRISVGALAVDLAVEGGRLAVEVEPSSRRS